MTELITLLNDAVEKRLIRPLDLQFALMIAGTDEPELLLAVVCLSAAAGEGHVCLDLDTFSERHLFGGRQPDLACAVWRAAGAPQDIITRLAACNAVNGGEGGAPLILVERRLYLNRLWQAEGQVADFFANASFSADVAPQMLRKVLDELFGQQPDDWQKVAAALALTRKVAVISGGPGTGKTTTVARFLAALIRLHGKPLRIQLATPTGKAAARLTQSLAQSLQTLSLSDEEKRDFPTQAMTLHRLLGAQPASQRLRHHADNPLHLDVLVIDEVSMVDLPMMANLIAALPANARVILLGDHEQLASVETGSVLGDICRCAQEGYSKACAQQLSALTGCRVPAGEEGAFLSVRDSICLLRKSYRFDAQSGIGRLAKAVKSGDIAAIDAIFHAGFNDINHFPLRHQDDYQQLIAHAADGYADYLNLMHQQAGVRDVIAAFDRYQLLCALREGPFGVEGLNARIEKLLLRRRLISKTPGDSGKWYAGRPVMIIHNDSTLGLFNGDLGITMPDGDGQLKVWFILPDGSIRAVHPGRLPRHETAFAMTVHKSQGSEFEHTALVLPDRFLPLLTRELIYTAITRAQKRLFLYGTGRIFTQAVNMCTQRAGGLLARIEQKQRQKQPVNASL